MSKEISGSTKQIFTKFVGFGRTM